MNLSWELLLPIIAKYGLPWVLDLVAIIKDHPMVDDAALEKLRAFATRSYDAYIEAAKARAVAIATQNLSLPPAVEPPPIPPATPSA